jgi:ABC-type multidrug transport system ATPase subunit
VILCSHALSEIEVVCDDVVILSVGQVVATGPVAEVIGEARQDAVRRNVFRIQVPSPSYAQAQQALEATPHVLQVTPADETAGWLRVEIMQSSTDGASPQEGHVNNRILDVLIRADIPVLSFEAEGGRLQDVFLHLTEEVIK